MHVDLLCPHCWHSFAAEMNSTAGNLFDRVIQEGPWCALGDGETLEDHLFHVLNDHSDIHCPECGELVPVEEESVGQVAREVLAQW